MIIAGSDSGAGAGIEADLKTFAAFGVYATTVITAITAQNTKQVKEVFKIPKEFVRKQIDLLMADIKPRVWKTGMLVDSGIINVVIHKVKHYKIKSLIVDPVLVTKTGKQLLNPYSINHFIKKIIPKTLVLTPNLDEAKTITKLKITNIEDMKKAAIIFNKMGAKNIVIKGGHLNEDYATDVLFDGKRTYLFRSKRIKTNNTHGTGCTFASAIAAGIAKGDAIYLSVKNAKHYIDMLLINSKKLRIGEGFGPMDHLSNL